MKNIGITMGDPKGIGPEVIAKSWNNLSDRERSHLILYGDRNVLFAAAEMAGTKFDQKQLVITSSTPPPVQNVDDSEAGRLAFSAIDAANSDALSGKIAGIVTGPVNKHRIKTVHSDFIGHTEFFSRSAHIRDATMMFASADCTEPDSSTRMTKQYCFSLATTHLPIKEVSGALTVERILAAIRNTHTALNAYFACPDARIAVMALNPHAGENGSLGHEEKSIIGPAIARAAKEGISCVGPLAVDKLFNNLSDFDYDAVIAMYHDQGLVPMKLICQKKCVNVTLGLPYIRTSPAHGTAEDIAWLGQADETGMLAAIRLARRMVGWRIEK